MNARAHFQFETTTANADVQCLAADVFEPSPLFYMEAEHALARNTEWIRALTKLESFKALSSGWDGEEAPAPDQNLVESVIEYLSITWQANDLPAPSRIALTSDATIFVEWQLPGYYMDLEVENPYEGRLYVAPADAPSWRSSVRWKRAVKIFPDAFSSVRENDTVSYLTSSIAA